MDRWTNVVTVACTKQKMYFSIAMVLKPPYSCQNDIAFNKTAVVKTFAKKIVEVKYYSNKVMS